MKCLNSCRSGLAKVWGLMNRKKRLDGDVMKTDLNRCLSTLDLTFIGLGHMMGAGVYILTGTIVKTVAGPATFISYILGGIASLLTGLCYAQFSVNIPKTGTAYNYIYVIAGEAIAFLAGWNLLLEYIISVASVGRSLSAYIDSLTGGVISNGTISAIGEIHSDVFGNIDFFAAGLVIFVFIIIAVGVRSSVNVNNVMALVNTIVILTFVVAAFVLGTSNNFNQSNGGFFPFGAGGALSGAGILFFAYVGFDAIAVASEESKNPSKSLPIAICAAILIAGVLYSAAGLALVYLVPYYLVDLAAPFPTGFHRLGYDSIGIIITVGASFGIGCSLLGQAFVLPRGILAIAEDGLIFSTLKYVNKTTKTPLVAIAISAILCAILAAVFNIDALVEMVSIGTLFAMALMTACLIKLHYLSVVDCPFELMPDGHAVSYNAYTTAAQESVEEKLEEKVEEVIKEEVDLSANEKKPILQRKNEQNLERIGKLRWQTPGLSKCDADTVTTNATILLFLFLAALAAMLVRGFPYIQQAEWWAVILLIISAGGSIISFVVILLHEHNKSFTKFSVPLVPWMPTATLFIQLCLMMTLKRDTWIRLIVWLFIGVIVYFGYGIRHSTAKNETYEDLEESNMEDLGTES